MPDAAVAITEDEAMTEPNDAVRAWEGIMAVEGRWTGDERFIMVDGLRWDGILPMPLTVDHEGTMETIGRVDEIERVQGATDDERFIIGRGVLNLAEGPAGDLARVMEQLIEDEFVDGLSIEPDAIVEGGVDPEDPELAPNAWPFVVESARLRCVSLVTTAAFVEAYITLGTVSTDTSIPVVPGPVALPADEVPEVSEDEDGIIIVASGHTITIPSVPPAHWYTEPLDVDIEGALTVTDDGRVYGLCAPAGTRHSGRADGIMAPMGDVNYARFMRGQTVVAGGGRVVSGNITMGCGHGPEPAPSSATIDHYDNSCSLVATVAVGERSANPRGVWVAGALLPGVTADQVRRIMAMQLSGHWVPSETPGFTRDLLAALIVPVPAFAMGRRSVTMREGAMVASSVPVQFESEPCGCHDAAAEDPRMSAAERRLERLERHLAPDLLASLELRHAEASLPLAPRV